MNNIDRQTLVAMKVVLEAISSELKNSPSSRPVSMSDFCGPAHSLIRIVDDLMAIVEREGGWRKPVDLIAELRASLPNDAEITVRVPSRASK